MSSPAFSRLFRIFLTTSVSLWMAGAGCLMGCSNSIHAASTSSQESCHAKTHDCCAKQTLDITSSQSVSSIEDANGVAREPCPLAVNASAEPSKANDGGNAQVQLTVVFAADVSEQSSPDYRSSPIPFLNRGPTYLRCCVFLI